MPDTCIPARRARAYDELAAARGIVKRVVLIGPSHFVGGRGRRVARTARLRDARLAASPRCGGNRVSRRPEAHGEERGGACPRTFARVRCPSCRKCWVFFPRADRPRARPSRGSRGGVERLCGRSGNADRHQHRHVALPRLRQTRSASTARRSRDRGPCRRPDYEEACGATGLNGLLAFAARRAVAIKLLAACNSGDTRGVQGAVVGYSTFALYDGAAVSAE